MVRNVWDPQGPFPLDKIQGSVKSALNVFKEMVWERDETIWIWIEIKKELRNKYYPPTFMGCLLYQLSKLRQEKITINECMRKFDELIVWCDIQEHNCLGFALDSVLASGMKWYNAPWIFLRRHIVSSQHLYLFANAFE